MEGNPWRPKPGEKVWYVSNEAEDPIQRTVWREGDPFLEAAYADDRIQPTKDIAELEKRERFPSLADPPERDFY